MRGMKKILVSALSLGLLLSFTSCDITEQFIDFDEIDTVAYENKTKNDETDDTTTDTSNTNNDDSKESSTEVMVYDETVKEKIDQYVDDYNDMYGYNLLSLDVNYGDLLTDVYESFYDASYVCLTSDYDYEVIKDDSFNYIVIDKYEYTNYRYTDVIASAWMTMIEENPIFYFLFTGYTVSQSSNGYYFYLLGSEEYAKAEDRNNCNLQIIDFVEDFEEEYNKLEEVTDYNKALLIHDYLCNNMEYAYDSDGNASNEAYAHNILGIINKAGVCESYAKLYLFLSYRIDLTSLIVIGYSQSQANGHAWNYCQIDGVWYGVDVTWDDSDTFTYDYFLVSSKIMNYAHTPYSQTFGISFQVPLPALSSSSYDTSKDETEPTPGSTGRHSGSIFRRY
ncbi:MAG: hypothetical protein K6E20_03945 [Acholeplasmatales bacterium]|nr:hypothetical protein [Acholeplasmatales bacterium]